MRTPTPDDEGVWGGRRERFKNPDSEVWLRRMAERGWTAPRWPVAYGGGGLSFEEDRVLQQELARIRARTPLNSFGVWMLGPALLEFANEEQKREHLPKIVRGEIRWCQGYSEPGQGSDLAALQTRADDQGDHYLVNGSKIWTSYADQADWIFCLVRTSAEERRKLGISFLLIDMSSPGVTVKPMLSGASSSSMIVTDVAVTEIASLSESCAVPLTETVMSGSSIVSSVGAKANDFDALVASAAIVISKSDTST